MYTIKLENIEKGKVGNKALALAEMLKTGFPIPAGFVIITDAYEKFLAENDLKNKIESLLANIDIDNLQLLKEKVREIESSILNSKIPEDVRKEIVDAYEELSVSKEVKEAGGAALDFIKAGRSYGCVAVRCSIKNSASFAGQTKTVLNVMGTERLLQAVKECYASLFSAKAIFYRVKKNIISFGVAILIQKMIDSEKSGTVFTINPVNRDKSKIVIETSFGLGEAVTSGLVTPDRYVIDKFSEEVLEKTISKKFWLYKKDELSGETIREKIYADKVGMEVLNENEIKKIFELALKLEEYYGEPQNVEWCIAKNRIFIVQTRSITLGKIETSPAQNNILVKGMPVSLGKVKGNIKIITDLNDLYKVENGDIVITKIANTDLTSIIGKASGIVTETGGITSNLGIVSREFDLPFMIVENATSKLKDGQEIMLDVNNSGIYETEKKIEEPLELDKIMATGINVIISDFEPEIVKEVDGCLLKIEKFLTESGKHPNFIVKTNPAQFVEIVVNNIGRVAKMFYPKSVLYYCLDIKSNDFKELEGYEHIAENNPILGYRGIRYSLEQGIFKYEIEAVKKLYQEGSDNIIVLLPFICGVKELSKVKEIIDFPLKIGIVVEIPATAVEIESFCKAGVDFVLIDLKNLTQLTLGVDKDNDQVSRLYSEKNSAVISLIKHVIKICKQYKVKTSISMGFTPELIETLIEDGINSISVEKENLEKVKEIVMRTEKRMLLENIRNKSS